MVGQELSRYHRNMKTAAAKTYMAHLSAGADQEAALAAATEMGELATDMRILKWMVAVVIALLGVVAAGVFQIALRLP